MKCGNATKQKKTVVVKWKINSKIENLQIKQGYDAGFHDAMVELDPDAEPLNDKGYVA